MNIPSISKHAIQIEPTHAPSRSFPKHHMALPLWHRNLYGSGQKTDLTLISRNKLPILHSFLLSHRILCSCYEEREDVKRNRVTQIGEDKGYHMHGSVIDAEIVPSIMLRGVTLIDETLFANGLYKKRVASQGWRCGFACL
jgi:hypothetical protein